MNEAKDAAAAVEIGVKKNVAKAKRTVKEKVAAPAEKAAGDLKAAADKVKLADEMAAGKSAAKRSRKQAEGKAKVETAKEAARKPGRKVAAAKLNINIQSPMGGVITPEEIAAKVPKDATDVYVRIDENRIYWVGPKGVGNVEIW